MTPREKLCAAARPDESEGGFTLAEVVVAMGLLMIFMGIFTTVTLMMTKTTTKTQRISVAVTQANQAFLALDKTVRYANVISPPLRSTAGTWHVEYNTTVVTNGAAKDVCTQLRVANQQLQSRTWTPTAASYLSGTLSPWRVIANNVTNGSVAAVTAGTTPSADQPFVDPDAIKTVKAAASPLFQRLTITILAAGVDSTTREQNRASFTLAATNSVANNSAAATTCQQVAVDAAT